MIEYQTVLGRWYMTGHDSRDDVDALPEQIALSGRCVFIPADSDRDGVRWVRVPAGEDHSSYRLAVRPAVFPVLAGVLVDDQGRVGIQLPAVAGGEPIRWVATPELFEDPGRGRAPGPTVNVGRIPFAPADPDVNGDRVVDLSTLQTEG